MSMGYIPKKRKQIRHERRMRKKYKNFSCETCRYTKEVGEYCSKRALSYGGVEKCEWWKASEEAKHLAEFNKESNTNNKKRRRGIFRKIFNN